MKQFMDDDFLLTNEWAKQLYHEHAKDLPIFDFHCHLSPKEIAENKSYRNITEIWLGGDHYKWRAMRSNGIDENLITGDASDREKFQAWAETMPYTLGNPLYHWSHLELQRYFGIKTILNETTAEEIWDQTNALLEQDDYRARGLLEKMDVRVVCTTDDAIDSLEYHRQIAEDETFSIKVLPALRPDKGINIQNKGFKEWVQKLAEASRIEIGTYPDFIEALDDRVQFFHEHGCRLSDHGLDNLFYHPIDKVAVENVFQKAMSDQPLSQAEIDLYKTSTLIELAGMYQKRGWTMQLHIGAIRNNNSRMFERLGPDTGYDSINDIQVAEPLSRLLDEIDNTYQLPKTILYCLNQADNDVIGTMIGNFQSDGIAGKIQFGSAWWFNDQKDGIERQLISLANLGLLRRFVGMVTDSRSFLSYIRHEYFRRTLCNLIGTWAENGEVPQDKELLGAMVEEICYWNASNYFDIE